MDPIFQQIMDVIEKSVLNTILSKCIVPQINTALSSFLPNAELVKLIESIDNYCISKKTKYKFIDTLVFPNMQTLFDVLYQPLTLFQRETDVKSAARSIINKYPKDIIERFQRIIIVDTGGMGKSTLSKKIFLSALEEGIKVPIYIELRNINYDNSILNEIKRQLEFQTKYNYSEELLEWFLQQPECLFIFDGLDEISEANRKYAIHQIHDFVNNHENGDIIITSRPEQIVLSFGTFQKFSIQPLTNDESKELIRRYDNYSHKPIADDLIAIIQARQNNDLEAFLQVPFLLSLIFKGFEYKKDISLEKSQFFKQVYDALFESHDLSKEGYFKREKYSKLGLDNFDRVLRHVAYFSAQENEVEYSRDRILSFIDKSKLHVTDLDFSSSDFLNDLLSTVPLFREEGIQVKWAHKSLQDYFAAKFIWLDAKDKQEHILRRMYYSENLSRYINIIDIYNELDPKGFILTILFWVLQEFKAYMDNAKPVGNFSNAQQSIRDINLYGRKIALYILRNTNLGIDKRSDIAVEEGQKMGIDFSYIWHRDVLINDVAAYAMVYVKEDWKIATMIRFLLKNTVGLIEETDFASPVIINELAADKMLIESKIDYSQVSQEQFVELNLLFQDEKRFNQQFSYQKLQEIENLRSRAFRNDLLNW